MNQNAGRSLRAFACALFAAVMIAGVLSGCSRGGSDPVDMTTAAESRIDGYGVSDKDVVTAEPETVYYPPVDMDYGADPVLAMKRQAITETYESAAVMFLGYCEDGCPDARSAVETLRPYVPDFTLALPDSQYVMTSDPDCVYAIVFRDDDTTVKVTAGDDDPDGEALYSSDKGEPIVLVCGGAYGEPDCTVEIVDGSGMETSYYPMLDEEMHVILPNGGTLVDATDTFDLPAAYVEIDSLENVAAGDAFTLEEYGTEVLYVTPYRDCMIRFYSGSPEIGENGIYDWNYGERLYAQNVTADGGTLSFIVSIPETIPTLLMEIDDGYSDTVRWMVENPGGGRENIDCFALTADLYHFNAIALPGPNGAAKNDFSYVIRAAVDYYTATYGEEPPEVSAQMQPNGTVLVQLYESFPDHNSTWAWYTIDPEFMNGVDEMTGETIDFSPYR